MAKRRAEKLKEQKELEEVELENDKELRIKQKIEEEDHKF